MFSSYQKLTLTLILLAGIAVAQNIVTSNQGKPGKQGPWPVTVQSGSSTIGTVTQGVGQDGGAWNVWQWPKVVVAPVATDVNCSGALADGGGQTAAPSSLLTNRVTITMFNNSNDTIYIGGSTVTTSTGLPLLPSASFSDNVGASAYYCISSTTDGGTSNLRVLEN